MRNKRRWSSNELSISYAHAFFLGSVFAGSCVQCATASQGTAQRTKKLLSYLKAKVGSEPYSLWATQPLRRRMQALLGQREYALFIRNMNPCGPIELTNGILSTRGNAPHLGTEEEAVLLIDPEQDVIEVIMMHGGKTVQA
jgi:hypothetical protein